MGRQQVGGVSLSLLMIVAVIALTVGTGLAVADDSTGGTLSVTDGQMQAEDGEGSNQIFGSAVLTAGAAIAVLTIVIGIAIAGAGALQNSRDGEPLDIDALDMSLTPADFKETGKTVLYFAASGLAIGLAAYVAIGWVLVTFSDATILSNLGIINDLSQLIGLLTLFLVGPTIAIVHGLMEGREYSSRESVFRTAAGCLIGAVVLVIIGMVIIGMASTAESPVGPMDVIAIAGLVGLVSLIGSMLGMVINNRPNLSA